MFAKSDESNQMPGYARLNIEQCLWLWVSDEREAMRCFTCSELAFTFTWKSNGEVTAIKVNWCKI